MLIKMMSSKMKIYFFNNGQIKVNILYLCDYKKLPLKICFDY